MILPDTGTADLTPAQRRIVEWDEGPVVVIAGAGTGKTRVIVERVAHLLRTKGALDGIPPEPAPDHDPFRGPLLPEQLLVLIYNVRAAKELADRIEEKVGAAARSRIAVQNFHSFCNRILADNAADAGLQPNPDVLDGIGQVLLLRDLRPNLPLVYHAGGSNPNYWLDQFVGFINRAKDELVTPDDFDAHVERERRAFEDRFGSYQRALERIEAQGLVRGIKDTRADYADFRRKERAEARGEDVGEYTFERVEKTAEREARRTVGGTGAALPLKAFNDDDRAEIEELARTYVIDGAALEVMRLGELALVYRAYQAELERRGALDFGEQIAAVTQLFKRRPNILRRYQRQYRYILVDEFQDANIAQIELIELLARTPDRPDNVMVVGDDDQSIYRFRGASFAAFAEFDRRFCRPPAHDPDGPTPAPPTRLRIEENFRSVDAVLTVANRLISVNLTRYEPDKRLLPMRGAGESVELVVCASPEDEAAAIVDAIKAHEGRPWSDIAVLYRKHKHREAIVARLRDEGIPYTVVGGLSLFETAEIRDLEQSLRAIADPLQDVALVRMMSAGPWRLDAIEIMQIARAARYDRRHNVDVIREVVTSGELDVDRVGEAPAADVAVVSEGADESSGGAGGVALQPKTTDLAEAPNPTPTAAATRPTQRVAVAPATRARLRRLLATLDELTPMTWREGPLSVLEQFVERTGLVLDLVAVDTLESKRMAANIASFLRFAGDWQIEHPQGSLAGFVDYLDAYQTAGGDLPTSVELTEDVEGVRLMTLYQAKGLEFPIVFVPQLLKDEWPAREYGSGLFPKDLLREQIPAGDIHLEEERRLLYVALTRARDRLTVTTHDGPTARKEQSVFVDELLGGTGEELRSVDRVGASPDAEAIAVDPLTQLRRTMPFPTAREARLRLRLQAVEVLGLLEGTASDPEGNGARYALTDELAAIAAAVTEGADSARARGLDPLSMRAVALDSDAGANLLDVLPLPSSFSYSQFSTFERCPAQYAFQYVYRIPSSRAVAAFSFGSAAHAAFEAFTKERRERAARGEPPPTRDDLERHFRAEWPTGEFGDQTTEETYQRRVGTLLGNFWTGELEGIGEAVHEELPFELTIEPDDGSPPFTINGQIDRVDRLPSGGIEIVDYKTGRLESQKGVDESLQLSIYALAARDALNLGTPERVTLYFTEAATRMSTTRSNEQLAAAEADINARVARIRSGDFTATPNPGKCWRCDYAPMCPARQR
jgi:DNA helicase-2/ATP-dependent DNA helicase PcrA